MYAEVPPEARITVPAGIVNVAGAFITSAPVKEY